MYETLVERVTTLQSEFWTRLIRLMQLRSMLQYIFNTIFYSYFIVIIVLFFPLLHYLFTYNIVWITVTCKCTS